MSPLAHRTIEADLDRLERQRLGYALALASSHDDRARARHERTLSRLDEEIEALHGALHAIVDGRGSAWAERVDTDAVPLLEQTAELTAAEYDDALQPRRPAWLWPVLGAAALALVGGLWLANRPPPPPAPAAAPPAVIVSSPVPPDSDAAPAR